MKTKITGGDVISTRAYVSNLFGSTKTLNPSFSNDKVEARAGETVSLPIDWLTDRFAPNYCESLSGAFVMWPCHVTLYSSCAGTDWLSALTTSTVQECWFSPSFSRCLVQLRLTGSGTGETLKTFSARTSLLSLLENSNVCNSQHFPWEHNKAQGCNGTQKEELCLFCFFQNILPCYRLSLDVSRAKLKLNKSVLARKTCLQPV